MRDFNHFVYWLKNYTDLSEYSTGRYSKAIHIIALELEEYGLPKVNLYNSNSLFINQILNNDSFKIKNNKVNRMYSSALRQLIKYLEFCNEKEFQEELTKDELYYEKNIISNISSDSNVNSDLIDEALEKPPHRIVSNHRLWSRNPKFASDSVANANYLCEFNNSHKDFISKYTQQNYVEAHHLIPIKYQEDFEYSLDVYANIVSLCMVCHKKLHYGLFDDKKEILDKLFASRESRLVKSNIDLTIDDLYNYYKD
ncbi:HNH endonuclease [Salinicoccus roseus]|uniref:HNH endonuclease n=1 Tax=Salinicoccus roseus TaxID=45670 RepID=UPI001CA72F64|nr:HNH endonuclease [Salinicoccus roseus]MBY8908878.1 HNH endonuclease [Salinicoccus roseus]